MQKSFAIFSVTHLLTLLIGFSVIVIFVLLAKYSDRGKKIVIGFLSFFCLTSYVFSQWAWSTSSHTVDLDNMLPFHLCDICAFLAGFAILTRKNLLCELTYYWGIAATLQALITPALSYNFPHLTYITFFLQHLAIVGVAIFLPLGYDWRPKYPLWKSPLRAFLWVNVYLVFAMILNLTLKTNFGFFAKLPPNPSLLDHLGPWPFYIIGMEGMALVLFFLLTLPFLRKST
jgi:hypothetical integral membrane protein (TIGR02206 family)